MNGEDTARWECRERRASREQFRKAMKSERQGTHKDRGNARVTIPDICM